VTAACALAVSGCRATTTGTDAVRATNNAEGDVAQRPSSTVVPRVRARPGRPVARCTAGEIRSLASTSVGVDPRAVIARGAQGAMVAYITRNASGAHALNVLALTATGTAAGAPREIAGAIEPSDPAIVATSAGYVLAFREHADYAGDDFLARERVVVMLLATDGTVTRWPGSRAAIAQGQPMEGAVTLEPQAGAQGFGVAALAADGGRVALVVARGRAVNQRASVIVVDDVLGAFRESSASVSGGTLDWGSAPAVSLASDGVRWAINGQADGAPSVASSHGAQPNGAQWIGRDVGAVAALSVDASRTLLGYVSTSFGGATVRLRPLGDESLPSNSVGVYSSSSATRLALVKLGADLVGAITLSHMADDATGSVNVSLADTNGAFIGRHAALASIRLRSSRVSAAAVAGSAWVLLDGRADDGAPVLGLVDVRCDEGQESNAQELPSATMVQAPTPADPAAVTAEMPTGLSQCTAQATPTPIVSYRAEGEDVSADASATSVVLRDGKLVFFARRRVSAEDSEVIAATVNADSSVVQRDAVRSAGRLLDAVEINGEAFAISSNGELFRSRGLGDVSRERLPVSVLASARFVRGGSGIVAFNGTVNGTFQLMYAPITAGRAGTFAAIAANAPRGFAWVPQQVLDAVAIGNTVHALVSAQRPDGSAVVRAVHSFAVNARGLAGRRVAPEPFADPLSIGGTGGALIASGTNLSMLFWDRETLRAGRVQGGVLREVRTVFNYLRGGGSPLAMTHTSADSVTVTALPGFPTNVDDMPLLTYAVTVHDAQGAPRSLSLATPTDTNAITNMGQGYSLPNGGIAVVYARAQPNGQLQWLVQRATCAQPARTANQTPTATPTNTAGGAR
jgi:hypothetical protein